MKLNIRARQKAFSAIKLINRAFRKGLLSEVERREQIMYVFTVFFELVFSSRV